MTHPVQAYKLSELRNAALYMFKERKFQELFEITCAALSRRTDTDHLMKVLFSYSLQEVSIGRHNIHIQNGLLAALQEEGLEYQKLSRGWREALLLDPFFEPFFGLKNQDDLSDEKWIQLEEVLASPLLLEGIKKILLDNPEYELCLTKLRRFTLLKLLPEEKLKTKHLNFICALAEQCYYNEYTYYVENDEEEALKQLSKDDPVSVAVLACYEPLHKLGISKKLSSVSAFRRLVEFQINYYEREQEIKSSLHKIGQIEDTISQTVQAMYEENPYPRWRYIDLMDPKLKGEAKVLIAGCGTGRFGVQAAQQLPNMQVKAIDISSSSLAYARRMSEFYDIRNIEFSQCDILKLEEISDKFDFINCSGVLHHMKDPNLGWQNLINKLNAGGIMLIGLYSTQARTIIDEAHRYVEEKGYKPTAADIRAFRRDVISLPADHKFKRLMQFQDFYSLSGLRDLVFHVQEKTYDIPELKQILDDLNLEFMGFRIHNFKVQNMYLQAFPDDKAMQDLDNWNELEHREPRLFGEMYNFWCRRKEGSKSSPAVQEIFDMQF